MSSYLINHFMLLRQHMSNKYRALTTLALLFCLFCPATPVYNPLSSLYIDKKTISSLGTVTLAWRQTLPAVVSSGLSVCSFSVTATKVLSFTAELVSPSTTGSQLAVANYGTEGDVVSVIFFIMVVTESISQIQIINLDIPWFPQGNTPATVLQPIAIASTSPTVEVRAFLQSIRCYSGTLIGNYHLSANIGPYPTFVLILGNSVPNYVEHYKLTILAVDPLGFFPIISSFVVTYPTVLPFNTDFGVPSVPFGLPFGDFRCIIGNTNFDFDPAGASFELFNLAGLSVTSMNISPNSFGYDYIVQCYAECPSGTGIGAASTYNCLPCGSSIPNCANCSSLSVCDDCMTYAYLSGSSCLLCNASFPHCYSCLNGSSCQVCDPTWFLMPGGSSCGLCGDFMASCLFCPSINVCSGCMDLSYYVLANSSGCGLCRNILWGCSACLNYTTCISCQNSTLFIEGGQCLICSQHIDSCYACTSRYVCLSCQDSTTYLLPNQTGCWPCNTSLDHCVQCLSISTCLFCEAGTILTLNNLCKYCDEIFPHCGTCHSASYCSSCESTFYLSSDGRSCPLCRDSMQYCIECSSSNSCTRCIFGRVVSGGCTKTIGCQAVVQSSGSGNLVGVCSSCDPFEFELDPSNRVCVCKAGRGKLVGEHCTTVTGCITTQLVGGVVICTYCNQIGRFLLNTIFHACQCQEGFAIQGQYCLDICGDGRVMTSQCDDGNTEDGDGCSSQCKIEVRYRCNTLNNTSPSVCQYIAYEINSSLVDTQRVDLLNQAIFTFQFSPTLSLLSAYDINSYFQISCDGEILSNVVWAYDKGQVTATVPFDKDLEGKQATVNFTFNRLFIPHDPVILEFPIKSKGLELIYYENLSSTDLLKKVFLGISCAALLLLLVGSWVNKMVGVEVVQVLQLVYYLHFAMANYTIPLSSLQSLSLLALNDLYWQAQDQNFLLDQQYSKVKFNAERGQITILFLAMFAGVFLLILFVYGLTLSWTGPGIQKLVKTILIKVYHCFTFPVTLAFISPYLLAEAAFVSRTTPPSSSFPLELVSLASLLVFAVTSMVLFNELKYLLVNFKGEEQKRTFEFRLAKRCYIPGYEFYLLAMTGMLWGWIRLGISDSLYPTLALSLLMIVFQLKYRPYFRKLDNFSILLNNSFLAAYLVFLLLRKEGIIQSTKQFDIFACIIIAGLSIACLFFSFLRVFREFFCEEAQSKSSQPSPQTTPPARALSREDDSQKEMVRLFAEMNPSNKEALLNDQGRFNLLNHPRGEDNNRAVDPELEKAKNAVRKTFKRKTNYKQRAVQQEREFS